MGLIMQLERVLCIDAKYTKEENQIKVTSPLHIPIIGTPSQLVSDIFIMRKFEGLHEFILDEIVGSTELAGDARIYIEPDKIVLLRDTLLQLLSISKASEISFTQLRVEAIEILNSPWKKQFIDEMTTIIGTLDLCCDLINRNQDVSEYYYSYSF